MQPSAAHRRVKAIYIVGPSSTGKTTLCKAFAAQLGLPPAVYITEVARTVMRETGFTRRDVARVEMQKAIMDKQLEQDAAARTVAGGGDGPGIVLSDRSAIDAIVYAALADTADGGTRSLTLIKAPEFQAVLPSRTPETGVPRSRFSAKDASRACFR
ncbi:hypothetical protein EWM64_g4843 [Hericium alpestre]|uniref:NadR/Ttd14 AAA domain-containing protein n=1 Tax=Hericium alpestre TaxID=135208 RepID=A0A4Z0A0E7_9AGAM|nr:hypothetical protein EWM64_g4843 [Hericium alpestre]